MNPVELLFEALFRAAEAFEAATPEPMTVTDGINTWTLDEGMCGFASVNIRPARGKFVNLLKDRHIGSTDSYLGGYTIYAKTKSQSYERNKAWAEAFAEVLRENGVNATAHSRID